MSLVLLPDAEQLVVAFLLDQPEITELVDDRVFTAIPKKPVWPLLLVRRVAGAPVTHRPLHLDRPTLQFDAYGGTKKFAYTLAATTRAVIAERIVGAHDAGVVTAVEFGPLSWLPDTTETPARPRYISDADLFTHP